MRYLKNRGIPVPEVYRQRENKLPYLEWEEEGQHIYLIVTEFMPGTHVSYGEESVKLIARLQAQMHEVAKDYPYQMIVAEDEYSAMSYRLKQVLNARKSKKDKNFPSSLYQSLYDVYMKNREQLRTYYANCTKRLLHCDIKADNMLMHDGQLSAVIDFRDIRVTVVAEDLGVFIWDLCDRLQRDGIEFLPMVEQYFNEYSRVSGSLSHTEKQMAVRYAIDRYLDINLYYLRLLHNLQALPSLDFYMV